MNSQNLTQQQQRVLEDFRAKLLDLRASDDPPEFKVGGYDAIATELLRAFGVPVPARREGRPE